MNRLMLPVIQVIPVILSEVTRQRPGPLWGLQLLYPTTLY